jgi:hypothetical protein
VLSPKSACKKGTWKNSDPIWTNNIWRTWSSYPKLLLPIFFLSFYFYKNWVKGQCTWQSVRDHLSSCLLYIYHKSTWHFSIFLGMCLTSQKFIPICFVNWKVFVLKIYHPSISLKSALLYTEWKTFSLLHLRCMIALGNMHLACEHVSTYKERIPYISTSLCTLPNHKFSNLKAKSESEFGSVVVVLSVSTSRFF